MSKIEIDVVTAGFFGAFDNRGGKSADVARIRRLMLPGGVTVANGREFTVYTVDEFIEPRRPSPGHPQRDLDQRGLDVQFWFWL